MISRIFLFSFILVLGLTVLSGMEKLPDEIYFRNQEQGFSYEHLYALKDGKIWIKPNTKNTGVYGKWELFNKSGIPSGDEVSSFAGSDRIMQFSTEGTMIAAVSNKGRFYIWQPTYKEKTIWRDETGAPFRDALYLPENKTWCFSLSTMRAPWKRQTPMHENDIVSYWEDIDGNKTEFGFTASIYIVSPDGQKIVYTDTGLPASWNRAFTSPERGKYIIENMSASASTIFVINETGKMYTKMIDFELEGGCPALRYVYSREKRTRDGEIAPLMKSIRTLPLPDWREQEAIDVVLAGLKSGSGQAALTGNITILLTGKGNAARELRVQGRDNTGKYGYWKKMIFDNNWKFVVTGEIFSESSIIKNYMSTAPEGGILDRNYRGKLKKSGEADLSAELIGFYCFSTPAVLRIHINRKSFDLKFHTVDLWSPTAQKKYFPELVGNSDGEPKLLQGTIVIPDDILDSSDAEIRNTVSRYFGEFNRQPLAFTVSADDRKVIIRSKTLQRSLDNSMNYEFRDCIKMDLINEDYDRPPDAGFFVSIAVAHELQLPPDISSFTDKDIHAVKKLIRLNQGALHKIRDINRKLKGESCTSGCASSCILPFYYVFNGIVSLIGVPHWDVDGVSAGAAENITQLGGVSYTGGSPVREYASMNLKEAFEDSDDYKLAVKILIRRLDGLGEICEKLSETPQPPVR
jgi:hypothetical protein